jgi:hypothetical protein
MRMEIQLFDLQVEVKIPRSVKILLHVLVVIETSNLLAVSTNSRLMIAKVHPKDKLAWRVRSKWKQGNEDDSKIRQWICREFE